MDELTAVDVLLLPDATARARAEELNALLREDLGQGFAFDETHLPHITLLQLYAAADDLDGLNQAVDAVVQETDVGAVRLGATGLSGAGLGTPPGVVVAAVDFEPAEEVVRLHEALLSAAGALAANGGSAGAFFTLPGEPPVSADTVAYVERFISEHGGERYAPHMSVGLARESLVERLRGDARLRFESRPAALAVCRLGDYGAARQVLRRWPVRA
ncbi:MAG: hypothetical protein GX624_02810 [Actinobacteria bacterium]|nr:hypothetical protein [Actinomycetota bacterium]